MTFQIVIITTGFHHTKPIYSPCTCVLGFEGNGSAKMKGTSDTRYGKHNIPIFSLALQMIYISTTALQY